MIYYFDVKLPNCGKIKVVRTISARATNEKAAYIKARELSPKGILVLKEVIEA